MHISPSVLLHTIIRNVQWESLASGKARDHQIDVAAANGMPDVGAVYQRNGKQGNAMPPAAARYAVHLESGYVAGLAQRRNANGAGDPQRQGSATLADGRPGLADFTGIGNAITGRWSWIQRKLAAKLCEGLDVAEGHGLVPATVDQRHASASVGHVPWQLISSLYASATRDSGKPRR